MGSTSKHPELILPSSWILQKGHSISVICTCLLRKFCLVGNLSLINLHANITILAGILILHSFPKLPSAISHSFLVQITPHKFQTSSFFSFSSILDWVFEETHFVYNEKKKKKKTNFVYYVFWFKAIIKPERERVPTLTLTITYLPPNPTNTVFPTCFYYLYGKQNTTHQHHLIILIAVHHFQFIPVLDSRASFPSLYLFFFLLCF